jgi:hypothetical protein
VQMAQGADFDEALKNATVNAIIQTGAPSVATEINKVVKIPAVSDAITSAGASALKTVVAGGNAADVEKNILGALVGSATASATGSNIAGAAAGGGVTGGVAGAAAGAYTLSGAACTGAGIARAVGAAASSRSARAVTWARGKAIFMVGRQRTAAVGSVGGRTGRNSVRGPAS